MTDTFKSLQNGRIVVRDRNSSREIWLSPRHEVYTQDLLDNFEYYYGAVQPRENHIVDYSNGRLHRVIGFEDFPIYFPSLAEPLDTCLQYLELAQLGGGETVLDLGAYCGLSTIAFAKRVGHGGMVVAAEPDATNAGACEMNLRTFAAGGYSNVRLLHCAVAGADGDREFIAEGNMGSGFAGTLHPSRGAGKPVPALTLESIARITRLERIDLVKMDIEGAELEVLRSSGAFLLHFRPRLIIEPHFLEGLIDTDAVVSCLDTIGFDTTVVPQRGASVPLILATPRVFE